MKRLRACMRSAACPGLPMHLDELAYALRIPLAERGPATGGADG